MYHETAVKLFHETWNSFTAY